MAARETHRVRQAVGRWCFPAYTLALLFALPAAAQDVQCAGCELRLEKIAELSSEVAPVSPSMAVSLARLAAGSYVMSHDFREPAILVYRPDGSLLRTYERTGRGPGEFRMSPRLFAGPGDTLLAVADGRLTRFAMPGFIHAGTHPLSIQIGWRATVLRDGRIATGASTIADGSQMVAIHLLSATGEPIASGAAVAVQGYSETAIAGPAADGGFWTGWTNGSDITYWTSEGVEDRRVRIDRGWFQPWTGDIEGETFLARPRPRTVALAEIAPGRMVVLTLRADPGWQPIADDPARAMFDPALLDQSNLLDSVLEVVDTESGAVLGRLTAAELLEPVQGAPGEFHSQRMLPDGHVVVDIWKLVFTSVRGDGDGDGEG